MTNIHDKSRLALFSLRPLRRTPVWPLADAILTVDMNEVRRDAQRLFETTEER